MGIRRRIVHGLEATLGPERTDRLRTAERRFRRQVADIVAPQPRPAASTGSPDAVQKPRSEPGGASVQSLGEPTDGQGGWIAADPFVADPKPTLTRHDLLRGLHERLAPRTYLEIGVNEGSSLTLSRTKSIGVDPEFTVRNPLYCDLNLVKAKSDEFFARPDPLAHFGGVPVDLAFIDGMHLSEFALRDYINVEHHLAPTGVTVFDDVLPRNPLEAARVRRTGAWAGDVYKAVEILTRRRPDLAVILINTWPTGTAVVVGGDTSSKVLQEAYPSEVPYLEAEDPQSPPWEYLSRSAAVDPNALLASDAWAVLVRARETGDESMIEKAKDILRSIPTLG